MRWVLILTGLLAVARPAGATCDGFVAEVTESFKEGYEVRLEESEESALWLARFHATLLGLAVRRSADGHPAIPACLEALFIQMQSGLPAPVRTEMADVYRNGSEMAADDPAFFAEHVDILISMVARQVGVEP
ncbi:MAG: hypothetical protein H6843_10425 [Rhodospirillaceae bacterium]|nr:hypothetical protein [Rhodospirillaceae bacterium]